jgi:NADPH:quinone reductase-like Zn-dependent oxidoreductase
LTDTMSAVVHDRYGDAEVLRIALLPRPIPGEHDVLIRVHAASLNPADKFLMLGSPWVLRLSSGLTRPRRPVRGLDVAGVIEAVGARVSRWRVGDEVFGEATGSLAQFACAKEDHLARVPSGYPLTRAAAVPLAGLAALHGLRTARLAPGHRLLVNGAAGGIGTCAVQIAKARGAHVTGVCSTRNVATVRALGADRVIDYTVEDFTTGNDRYDVIFDNVGNHPATALQRVTVDGGTVLLNSGEKGPDGRPITRIVKSQWHQLTGRRRFPIFISSPNPQDLAELAGMLADGTLAPVIDTTFPLDHAADAMARLATRHACGKVVVTVRPQDAVPEQNPF